MSGVEIAEGMSDHKLVMCLFSRYKPPKTPELTSRRQLGNLDTDEFMERLLDTSICWQPEVTVDAYCAQMKNDIVGILDDIALMRTRSKLRSDAGHFLLSDEALEAKRMRRRLEAKWDESGAEADRVAYRRACRDANALIVKSRASLCNENL